MKEMGSGLDEYTGLLKIKGNTDQFKKRIVITKPISVQRFKVLHSKKFTQ